MADPRLPQEMDAYMEGAGWGAHHVLWHLEQRYDVYQYRAAQGDAGAAQTVAYGDSLGWKRAAFQEGAPGHGVHFLAMHRAMFEILEARFPQHRPLLSGWITPPQDPTDGDDPVPTGAPFEPAKAEGVVVVEQKQMEFASEDEWALFLETSLRPTAQNPTTNTPDRRTGLHNFLHNRWTDSNSPVNLGDPEFNIFNARFWRLHGWIDRLWSQYRTVHGLPDDPEHLALIASYRHMMEHGGHHHLAGKGAKAPRPDDLKHFFAG